MYRKNFPGCGTNSQVNKTQTVRTETDPSVTSKATRPTGNAAHSQSFHGDATSEHKDNEKERYQKREQNLPHSKTINEELDLPKITSAYFKTVKSEENTRNLLTVSFRESDAKPPDQHYLTELSDAKTF